MKSLHSQNSRNTSLMIKYPVWIGAIIIVWSTFLKAQDTNLNDTESIDANNTATVLPGKAVLKVTPTTVEVNTSSIKLECSTDNPGTPPYTKTHFYINQQLQQTVQGASTVELTPTNYGFNGDYQCRFSNDAGGDGEMSDSVSVQVLVPPEIHAYKDASEKDLFGLRCIAFGVPEVNVSIVHTGNGSYTYKTSKLRRSGFRYGVPEATQLDMVFHPVTDSENVSCFDIVMFDGTYRCMASNLGPNGEERKVESKEVFIRAKFSPIWIEANYNSVGAPLGTKAEVKCHICANPYPTRNNILWFYKGELVGYGDRYIIGEVSGADYGDYTCMVYNGLKQPINFTIALVKKDADQVEDREDIDYGKLVLVLVAASAGGLLIGALIGYVYLYYIKRQNPDQSHDVEYSDGHPDDYVVPHTHHHARYEGQMHGHNEASEEVPSATSEDTAQTQEHRRRYEVEDTRNKITAGRGHKRRSRHINQEHVRHSGHSEQ